MIEKLVISVQAKTAIADLSNYSVGARDELELM